MFSVLIVGGGRGGFFIEVWRGGLVGAFEREGGYVGFGSWVEGFMS